MITCIKDDSYLEFTNDHKIVKSKEFLDWVLSLKPKDVRDEEISQQALYKVKAKIKIKQTLNSKVKIIKTLLRLYKDTNSASN